MIRDLVMQRSGGRCEAMVRLPRTWTRCGRLGVDDHHMLTRARGGGVLDSVGETYHHLALCRGHHRMADDEHLIIDGYVWSDAGVVTYKGPDEYLSEKYPGRVLQPSV